MAPPAIDDEALTSPELPVEEVELSPQDENRLIQTLRTSFEDVFTLSPDGSHFVFPAALRGVPRQKITEDSPYWSASWKSLEEFLAQEKEECSKKRIYQDQLSRTPDDKNVQKKAKLHQDNVSKHIKIREYYGPKSNYHPNQLIAKIHMPPEGLSLQEIMYRSACKISDLDILASKGYLTMDPFDFYRWRLCLKVQEALNFPGDRSKQIKSVITKLADDNTPSSQNRFGDPIMRGAAILAAKLQNRLGVYKIGVPKPGEVTLSRMPSTRRKSSAGKPSASKLKAIQKQLEEENEARRREKRKALASRPSTYNGVNDYRAKRQAEGRQ